MNFLHKYSLNCGVKPDKPTVSTSYFPVSESDYIIIDGRNKYEPNQYNLFQDVLYYLRDTLNEKGIQVFSFQQEGSNLIEGVKTFTNLNPKQEAFLIKKSLLVIGCDNTSNHYASYLDIPNIGLYSTFPSSCTKPLFGPCHAIESDRMGNLPGYGVQETPKAVNLIPPEKVANKVCEILGFKRCTNHQTIFTGKHYATKVVEVCPDFIPDPNFLLGRPINIRMDLHFDQRILFSWLQNRRANILIDKPIDRELVEMVGQNILQITININDSFDEGYLKFLRGSGVTTEIFCEDKDKINDFRFKFFDFDIHQSIFGAKSDLEDAEREVNKNTSFFTGKPFISKNSQYSCFNAREKNNPLESSFGMDKVYDTNEFWRDVDHYRIVNFSS